MKRKIEWLLTVVTVAALILFIGYTALPHGSSSEALELVIFKIGKADAAVLSCGGYTMLIDTGEDEDAEEILEYLERKEIQRIDVLVLSHFDKDHVGGADKIINAVSIDRIYEPDYSKDSAEYEEYRQSLEGKGIQVHKLTGEEGFPLGAAQVTVYAPFQEKYEQDNDYSLAVGIVYGKRRLLFTGDAEEERIGELLGGGLGDNPQYDFIKMPHHGKACPGTEALLDQVRPDYAVITCSDKNPPDEAVLELLRERGIKVFETRNGNVYGECSGEDMRFWQ